MTRRPVEPQMQEILLDGTRHQSRFGAEICKAIEHKGYMYYVVKSRMEKTQFNHAWDKVNDDKED